MAARPPSNDIDDEPDTGEFGIVALDGYVDKWDVSFPIACTDLAARYGDERVAVDPAGHEIALSEALEACDRRSFDSKQDMLNALQPVFEARRERLSGSILGRLRTLVPF